MPEFPDDMEARIVKVLHSYPLLDEWKDAIARDILYCEEVEHLSMAHRPKRYDDVELWLKRERDKYWGATQHRVIDKLLDRYRECADYGLSLRPEDDKHGDP